MRLILNGINGEYLRGLLIQAESSTEYIDAAVAYATDTSLLFDWCLKNKFLLRYWGRFDDATPVAVSVLSRFLKERSPNFICKLIRHFHPKVIWWHGFGVYVGSANLTQSAWHSNIEAGVFISEAELIDQRLTGELEAFFKEIDVHATPLTEELFAYIRARDLAIDQLQLKDRLASKTFLEQAPVVHWPGLSVVSHVSAIERSRRKFIEEWNSTLQLLRDLAHRVSQPENRPSWIRSEVPPGAQADQFLHAHYYKRTFEGQLAKYEEHHQRNLKNPAIAEADAISWWRSLPQAPLSESRMLDEWAPFVRERLTKAALSKMSELDFVEVCLRVYAIRDHARRVANSVLGLPSTRQYSIEEKTEALAKFIWKMRSKRGEGIADLLYWILYGGPNSEIADRIWEAHTSNERSFDHFGVSAIGEIVGWALPDRFPPRNGRTSKALRSLGHDVALYAE